jgi:hypothetical protein
MTAISTLIIVYLGKLNKILGLNYQEILMGVAVLSMTI